MQLQKVQNKIHEVRNQKVMLDFDLAALYEVETKNLNPTVKRNLNRFPADFMFRLTIQEWTLMRLQFETASQSKRNTNVTPYAFTEKLNELEKNIVRNLKMCTRRLAI